MTTMDDRSSVVINTNTVSPHAQKTWSSTALRNKLAALEAEEREKEAGKSSKTAVALFNGGGGGGDGRHVMYALDRPGYPANQVVVYGGEEEDGANNSTGNTIKNCYSPSSGGGGSGGSPNPDPSKRGRATYANVVNIGGIRYATSYVPIVMNDANNSSSSTITGGDDFPDQEYFVPGSSSIPSRNTNSCDGKNRSQNSLLRHHPDNTDRRYPYDKDSYPGEIVHRPPTPELKPNYNTLLRDTLVAGGGGGGDTEKKKDVQESEESSKLSLLTAEIEKLQDRKLPSEILEKLSNQYRSLTTEVEGLKTKLSSALRRASVDDAIPPSYVVPCADDEPERLLHLPSSWKREEDDETIYAHRVQSLKLHAQLSQLRYSIAQEQSLQSHVEVLTQLQTRLDHDYVECLGLLEYQKGISNFIDIVLSEGERSIGDEETVKNLHLSACIDESRAKQTHPTPAMKILPYSDKEKSKHEIFVDRAIAERDREMMVEQQNEGRQLAITASSSPSPLASPSGALVVVVGTPSSLLAAAAASHNKAKTTTERGNSSSLLVLHHHNNSDDDINAANASNTVLGQCQLAVDKLRRRHQYQLQTGVSRRCESDMASSYKVWGELHQFAQETRSVIHLVNKGRDERRSHAERHYNRVRDAVTESQLQQLKM